jgi:hypothetical protein
MLSVTNKHFSECRYADCYCAYCYYAESYYAESYYAECRGTTFTRKIQKSYYRFKNKATLPKEYLYRLKQV